MNRITLILLSLGFLYTNTIDVNHHMKNPSWIFTFGNSTPTNIYDSYGSKGFAFKLAYERPIEDSRNFRINFGWQNISFGENLVSYDEWSDLQIREGEKANLFDIGLKFVLNDGITGNGLFRPYINTSFGLGFFKQYTEYDYPDTYANPCDGSFLSLLFQLLLDDSPCEGEWNDNMNTIVNDRMSSSFITIDLGTSFAFNNRARYAIDFGVRYNMIKNIEASDWSSWYDLELGEQSFDEIVGRKLKADYQTFYLGVSFYLAPFSKKNKEKRGYGKQI
tara:strand:- start:10543 stop:11373 length:831 start_codon:yes stop_codon:yes gene_type:complete